MKCDFDPKEVHGAIGMFHCPKCGEMVVAGVSHPNYEFLDLNYNKKEKENDDSSED